MRLKALFGTFLTIFIVFNACKKSEGELTVSRPKIKSMTTYNGNSGTSVISFEYDLSGRLSKQIYPDAYDRFVYAPGIIIKERHYNDRNEVFNDTLFLNKQGLVIAESGKDIAYEYNLDGYQSELRAGEILSYTISNGNTLTRKAWEYIDGNLKLILTTNYRFIPNSINTIGNENMGISFYGKQDKNLRSGANFTLDQNMTTPEKTATYEYEFDTKKRVTKSRDVEDPGNHYTLYTYYD